MIRKSVLSAVLAALPLAGAQAGVVLAPTTATINAGGPGSGDILDTINQFGLFSLYSVGVTDFDAYFGTNPVHTRITSGSEWFSNRDTSAATVTYGFASTVVIDALALWNEEASGIGLLNVLVSTDNIAFTQVLGGLGPTDNPAGADYQAQIFSFSAVSARYVRLDMSKCPQPNGSGFVACSIGEVAFRSGQLGSSSGGSQVPEPASLALLGAGLAGLAASRRRKRG